MDALDLLKADHDKVKSLFRQVQSVDSIRDKLRAFQRIDEELSVHSRIEETIFYPAFMRYDECKALIESSMKEHQQVDQLLNDIENLEQHSTDIPKKIDQLIQAVTQHIEKEETELFPMVRRLMKRPERETLGRHLDAAKQEQAAA